MDVSGWTVDQRMRLPDWCLGNRQVVGVYLENLVAGVDQFGASIVPMPDPVCIWSILFEMMPTGGGTGYVRIGINDHVPVDAADMDGSVQILPDYGVFYTGPNIIMCIAGVFNTWNLQTRLGMDTNNFHLVVQNHCIVADFRSQVSMVISGLPTSMAGWMAHNK